MIEIFIGYSHKDQDHRDSLETHLSLLKRRKAISTWSDRKIDPGENWDSTIHEKLESANVIIFLVSSDFIASDYCVDIELKRALEKHKQKEAVVMPIITRPCHWQDSDLGSIQALPEDAKPITTWPNRDEAWLNVVEGLKANIDKLNTNISSHTIAKNKPNVLNPDFKQWLIESEVELSHRHKEKIVLDDIFVYQDLRTLRTEKEEPSKTISTSDPSILREPSIIFGEEQTGKTSLSKILFAKALDHNLSPVLINGRKINKSNARKLVKNALRKQYLKCDYETYISQSHRLLIIDDYSFTTLNRKHQNLFIENSIEIFDSVLILADQSFRYVATDIASINSFKHYELRLFGNLKRYELIKKWIEIGVSEHIDEHQLYQDVDTLKNYTDVFVRKNIVPSKPLYLLTILQTYESYSPLSIELTSHGHCYQYLIYKALEKSNIPPQEIDPYINCLTEFAGFLFQRKKNILSKEEMRDFFTQYNGTYLALDQQRVIEKLVRSSIITSTAYTYEFKYRYIYYFYAAKHLSENLHKTAVSKNQIHDLIANLHKEDSANIIVFITHHTKDSWILDEIQLSMMELFVDSEEAKLERAELSFMGDFIEGIPQLVLEQRDADSERATKNRAMDKADAIESKIDEQANKLEPTDLLAKVNRTFKAIEITGQIIKNRHGSLGRDDLTNLLEQAYNLGLRFLRYFLDLSNNAKDEIVTVLQHHLIENPNISNEQLEKEARNIFLMLTYGVLFGVLSKIAHSVGSKELSEVYYTVDKKMSNPAVTLITQTIELQFMKNLDITTIKKTYHEFSNNPACARVLKELVLQYIYMHHVTYKEKQQISEVLGLPIKSQLHLEGHRELIA